MTMRRSYLVLLIGGVSIALVIALFSPLASSHPDGLERVAGDKGFLDRAKSAPYEVLPDYTVPGIDHEKLTTIAAGIIGVLIVAGLAFGAGWLLSWRNRARAAGGARGTAGSEHQ
jgi:hypothetical protein